MLQFIFILAILAVAGCLEGPSKTGPEDPGIGACDFVLPDGREADCLQHAQLLVTEEPLPAAYPCVDHSPPTPHGQIRLRRDLVTTETFLQLELNQPGSHGVVWLESNPAKMMAWQSARGDEVWSIGPVANEDGDSIRVLIYNFTVRDLNDTTAEVHAEQRWTKVEGQPYAIHAIQVPDSLYFFDVSLGWKQDDVTFYHMIPFRVAAGPHLFEANVETLMNGGFTVSNFLDLCSG